MKLVENIMDKTSGIWENIEKLMKIIVPKYIKSILMYCGYNDFHKISSFKQTDLNNIVTEVRRENVTNYYRGLGINDAMEGSSVPAENFEFVRGHERLLMAIVNFVKQHLCDYDANVFSIAQEDVPKIENENLTDVRTVAPLKQDERDGNVFNSDVETHHNVWRVHEDIIEHQHTLLKMAVTSLSAHTPKMYEENIETIANVMSTNFVRVITLNPCDQPQYSAEFICPYCFEVVSVIHNATWIISPFDHHLQNNHENKEKRQKQNVKDIIAGFTGSNQNLLEAMNNCGKMSKGQPTTESIILIPKIGDYVLFSLKESFVQWPSSVPVVKYYVGQVLSVQGTINIKVLPRKEHTKLTFHCLKEGDTRTVAEEEIIKILEIPIKNRRNDLVFKDKMLFDI